MGRLARVGLNTLYDARHGCQRCAAPFGEDARDAVLTGAPLVGPCYPSSRG